MHSVKVGSEKARVEIQLIHPLTEVRMSASLISFVSYLLLDIHAWISLCLTALCRVLFAIPYFSFILNRIELYFSDALH